MSSYNKIDYRIRPAKYAERLMMCDALRRLKFASVESYQYVGLGSVYFTDFALFHKALGISRMVSIERETDDQPRFEFNLPYSNIEMRWGNTSDELPGIDLQLRTIAWLDYDEGLAVSMLNDVNLIAMRAASGSVLIVSVQCNPPEFDAADPRKHVAKLSGDLGHPRVDQRLDDERLQGFGVGVLYRDIIVNEIRSALAARNGMLPPAQQIEFEQIFNFHYADGAHMLTVGGVLFDRGQRGLFTSCTFEDVPFVRTGTEAFRIGVPKLTLREMRMLEAQLPLPVGRAIERGAIPRRDASTFVKNYRYLPTFAPVEL